MDGIIGLRVGLVSWLENIGIKFWLSIEAKRVRVIRFALRYAMSLELRMEVRDWLEMGLEMIEMFLLESFVWLRLRKALLALAMWYFPLKKIVWKFSSMKDEKLLERMRDSLFVERMRQLRCLMKDIYWTLVIEKFLWGLKFWMIFWYDLLFSKGEL